MSRFSRPSRKNRQGHSLYTISKFSFKTLEWRVVRIARILHQGTEPWGTDLVSLCEKVTIQLSLNVLKPKMFANSPSGADLLRKSGVTTTNCSQNLPAPIRGWQEKIDSAIPLKHFIKSTTSQHADKNVVNSYVKSWVAEVQVALWHGFEQEVCDIFSGDRYNSLHRMAG